MELVAVDIGGTNARFAIATVSNGGVTALGEEITLKTADHPRFHDAWAEYDRLMGGRLPRAAAFSIAAPVTADVIRLVNNPWEIERASMAADCDLDTLTVVNDFAAVGHAVAQARPDWFAHVAGPDTPLPAEGTISILGPGTGLGVAHLWRKGDDYRVQSTEGGHFSFAPLDPTDDALLARLRARHGRVSAERVVSGPGIVTIHAVLAQQQGLQVQPLDDKTLWQRGISGEDALSAAAVQHFCKQLGAVSGDVTLTQGGTGVVIAGGLGLRLRDVLPRSGFAQAFRDKGRFGEIMAAMPVKLITHPQPGLFGAAAAFAKEHVPS